MKLLGKLFLGCLCICAAPTSAWARQSAQQFADCLVRSDPSRMQLWVDSNDPGLIYKEVGEVSERTGCTQSQSLEYWTIRGALAEALSRDSFLNPPDLSDVPPITDAQKARWINNDPLNSRMLNVVSECLAQRFTGLVSNILSSSPGSQQEHAQIALMQRIGGECYALARRNYFFLPDDVIRSRLAIAYNQLIQRARTMNKVAG